MKKILLSVSLFFALFSYFLLLKVQPVLAYSKYFIGKNGIYKVSETKSNVLSSGSSREKSEDKDEGGDDKDEDNNEDKNDDSSSNSGSSNSNKNKEKVKVETKIKSTGFVESKVETELKKELELEDSFDDENEIEDDLENELDDSNVTNSLRELEIKRESELGKIEIKMNKDGKVELKVESKDPKNTADLFDDVIESSEADDILSILPINDLKGNKIKIKTENGELEIESNIHSTTSKFPLTVDPATNTLVVTTPSGNVNLNVLPDSALNALLKNKHVDTVSSSELEADEDAIKSGVGEKLVYKVEGYKTVKLLGFIPVAAKVQNTVGAQTGAVLSENNPWYLDIFGFMFTK